MDLARGPYISNVVTKVICRPNAVIAIAIYSQNGNKFLSPGTGYMGSTTNEDRLMSLRLKEPEMPVHG